MRVGIMRRGLAFVFGAVLGVVIVTSALTHKTPMTHESLPLGFRVAHPDQMNVPADLIAIP